MARNPFQGDDVDPFSAARDEEGDIKESKTRSLSKEIEEMKGAEATKNADAPKAEKKQTFAEAFRNAKDGSTFTWNGKQYKKEYAQPKAKAPDLSSARGGARSTGRGGATAAEMRAAEPPNMSSYRARRPEFKISDVNRPGTRVTYENPDADMPTFRKGGKVSASSRADGIAKRGKTKGKMY